MAVDLSDDYKTVDIYEPVTLVSRSTVPPIYDEELAVTYAFRGGLTYKELAATSGAAIRMEAAFDIPKTLIADYTWKPGDTIRDQDDITYNIYLTMVDPGTAFWRFLVYNPKIAYDLRHVIDVYDLEFDKDAAGALTLGGEQLLYKDQVARVQWTSGQPTNQNNKTGELHKATIYLANRLYLTNNSLIRWYDPAQKKLWQFETLEWSMPDRLDELMRVAVQVIP